MIGNLLQPELIELIHRREFNQLREILVEFTPVDLAEILADLSPEDKAILLRILPQGVAADVFEHLSLADQEALLQALGSEDVSKILNDLSPDDRTALLEEMPAAATQKLLNLLSPAQRKVASELLGYPKNSIGRSMTPDYVAIQQDWNVGEVLAHLRKVGRDRESLNQLYVVDAAGRLVDWVRLRKVVVSEPVVPVTELLESNPVVLRATDDQETAVGTFRKYDSTMLPVVNTQGVLVGVVTVDDVLDIAEEEATEDIQKLGGVEALDAPYLQVGLFSMIKKRAGWLAALFLGEMLTASAMSHYQVEIEHAVVLSLFVPLIISSGGNAGSQATSLIIRSMAVKDVQISDWWRVFRREFIAGLALGCVLAIVGFTRIVLWQKLGLTDYGAHHFLVAATVSCSLVGVVLFGSLIGSMLPFLLRWARFDPAVSSAPLVATLVDVTGLIIYFSIAFRILRGTLL